MLSENTLFPVGGRDPHVVQIGKYTTSFTLVNQQFNS